MSPDIQTPAAHDRPADQVPSAPVTRSDGESPNERAVQMMRAVLPDEMWSTVKEKGVIEFTGSRGTYIISPYSPTDVRDPATGRHLCRACLQLSIAAPAYDRMLTEYILLRNDEEFYWKTANILEVSNPAIVVMMILSALDLFLFLHLLLPLL